MAICLHDLIKTPHQLDQEMAQWLSSFIILAEDSGSVLSSSHLEAHNYLTLVPGDQTPSCDHYRHQACTWCTDKHAEKIHTYKINIFNFLI